MVLDKLCNFSVDIKYLFQKTSKYSPNNETEQTRS